MDAQTAFRNGTLYTEPRIYTFVKLPAQAAIGAAGLLAELAEPFAACIFDKDELSLVIPSEAWEDFGHRLPGASQSGAFRLITFDVIMDFDVVGFMALVSRHLADANVPLIALSAFSRDHILVPTEHFDTAWTVLTEAQQEP